MPAVYSIAAFLSNRNLLGCMNYPSGTNLFKMEIEIIIL